MTLIVPFLAFASTPWPADLAILAAFGLGSLVTFALHKIEVRQRLRNGNLAGNSISGLDPLAARRLQVEIARGRRYNRPLTLMMLRLHANKFHAINSNGATDGPVNATFKTHVDRMSQVSAAAILRTCVRDSDIVTWDAIEQAHVVMFTESDPDSSRRAAARVTQLLSDRLGASLNVGLADFPLDAFVLDDLLQRVRHECRDHYVLVA